MAFLSDNVLDDGLQYITDNGNVLYICSAEPSDYTEASSTYALGSKSSPSIGSPENGDASGRKVTVSTIADGTVSGTDTATHWAIVYSGNTELLAASSLASGIAVENGHNFSLTAFDIELPDPA